MEVSARLLAVSVLFLMLGAALAWAIPSAANVHTADRNTDPRAEQPLRLPAPATQRIFDADVSGTAAVTLPSRSPSPVDIERTHDQSVANAVNAEATLSRSIATSEPDGIEPNTFWLALTGLMALLALRWSRAHQTDLEHN